mgnify:CR=1 FL=1
MNNRRIALIESGNRSKFMTNGVELLLKVNSKKFQANYFVLIKKKKTNKIILNKIKMDFQNNVIISVKGNGVGFYQWRTINLSRKKKNFEETLYFYFLKTKVEKYYD